MSSLSPAAETLRNNDVLWLCVSESDCQSQISVGCRRSGNIRNLSAVVRVCLWKGCDVFVAEKKSRTVLFPHFLPLKGEEERRRRKWGKWKLSASWLASLAVSCVIGLWLLCFVLIRAVLQPVSALWLAESAVSLPCSALWLAGWVSLPAECNRACCWSSCGSTSGLYMLISVWI